MATLHIITGKGGVGKSSLSVALALSLLKNGERPILLLEVQGSGQCTELLGIPGAPIQAKASPRYPGLYACRILALESFKEYFSQLLALGKSGSSIAGLSQNLRNKVSDLLVGNKVVKAFIDVCPGLEPVVLLGKIHNEAKQGKSPSGDLPWKHVIVDAPATGHGLMLFKSSFALMEVFKRGTIYRQSEEIHEFVADQKQTKIHIATLPEELPLQESLEMQAELQKLGLELNSILMNRVSPQRKLGGSPPENWSERWINEWKIEEGLAQTQAKNILAFRDECSKPIVEFPEVFYSDSQDLIEKLSEAAGKIS